MGTLASDFADVLVSESVVRFCAQHIFGAHDVKCACTR
ncbi:hypothetical protein HMPREF1247_0925 [Atopobium sp. BV3Ac4]|nr:hypothetical protein HMPREF1247_0925 [Atopobium sp. BV3Ac4]